ncbi:MAG: AAA family ATPase [Deltaproteobacteria bacterium]|nr:AAA family ATPase [Deltaproteobacteria bacterium]
MPAAGESAARIFVGREREMQVLRSAVEGTLAGRGRLVLLAGEPGIGKTLTCEEVAAYARRRAAQVFWGQCYEGEGAPAFWPWAQVLRASQRQLGGAGAELAHVELAQIVPELRQQVPELPSATRLDSPEARFRLFESVRRFIEQLSQRAPLVIILDDIHCADRSSLLLLQFLAHELRGLPVLILGTYRDTELRAQQPLAVTVAEALREPGTERITLAGLGEAEVGRFIELSAGARAAAALVAAVHQRTEGNPLFVSEVLRGLLAEGGTGAIRDPGSLVDLPVPPTVQAAIGRHLAPLSPECHALLGAAAVLGREFSLDLLEAVTSSVTPPDLTSIKETRRRVYATAQEAVSSRVIVPIAGMAGCYRFAHALIRDALCTELEPGVRARLHGLVGNALERLPTAGEHVNELAYHFFEARDAGRASAYARRAGDRALAMFGYEEAIRLYQRALIAQTWQVVDNAGERCEVLLALGEAYRRAGSMQQARANFERAATLARAQAAPERLARAALGYAGLYVEIGTIDHRSAALLEEALALVGEDGTLRARLLASLALQLSYSVHRERSASLSGEAVAIAQRVGDAAALAYTLGVRYVTAPVAQAPREQLATASEMVAAAQTANEPTLMAEGRGWRIESLLVLADRAAIDAEVELHRQLAQSLHEPVYLWLSTMFQAMQALMAGRFDDAERLALSALSLGQSAQNPNAQQAFAAQMFILRGHQGRLAELEAVLNEMVARYPGLPVWRASLAHLYCEIGQRARAQEEFARLAAAGFAASQDSTLLIRLALLAQTCAALSDAARARPLYELLRPYGNRNIAVAGGATSFGAVARYLGLLATTLRNWDQAERHFVDALATNGCMGAQPFVAHTEYDYAAMRFARGLPGDREQAASLCSLALARAREIGMKGLVERAEALGREAGGLGRWNGHLPSESTSAEPAPGRSSQPQAVFRREGDYWVVSDNGCVLHLKDSKGLQYLAYLLRHPGREFHALDLAKQHPETRQLGRLGLPITNGMAILDGRARADYSRRLADLREDIEEAERHHDTGRAGRLRQEVDFITEQVAAAVGLGGRNRTVADGAERARVAVSKRIKEVVKRIRDGNPKLGHYLSKTIKTGTLCAYVPDPERSVVWAL